MTVSNIAAVAFYLENKNTTLKNKGAPWQNIAIAARVKLVQANR